METTRDLAVTTIKQMQTSLETLPFEEAACYAMFLSQTYYYVRHATRVLCKAAARCTIEEEPIHKMMIKGVNEEKNHEIMATNDLAELGFKISDFPELAETQAYYQTLYHQIDFGGPYALMGYFVTLEGLGAIGCDQIYDRIVESHGKDAIQFIKVHAKLDKHHFEDGLSVLKGLNTEQIKIVNANMKTAGAHYVNFLNAIKEQYTSYVKIRKTA